MSHREGRSIGLALLLAAGVLAVVVTAVLLLSPAGVGAHECLGQGDMHEDFRGTSGVPCAESTHDDPHEHTIEVDGGRDRDLEFKVYMPSEMKYYDNLDNFEDSVVIRFDDSFDLPDTLKLSRPKAGADPPAEENLITISRSGSQATIEIMDEMKVMADDSKKEITLIGATDFTNGDPLGADEYITITIKAGTGIETPETPWGPATPRDPVNSEEEVTKEREVKEVERRPEKGYEVFLTFRDGSNSHLKDMPAADRNFVVVKNPIDSTVPGATVRVELATFAEEAIETADDIVVDFSGPSADSGFIVPSSITKSRITVHYDYQEGTYKKKFNPSEVQVQGERVTFAVPLDKDGKPISVEHDYRIDFSKLARIKTPFSAGIKTIKVSSSVGSEIEDTIEAIVLRTTTISPREGVRGSEFTLEGKGYATGTVTVFEGDDDIINPGETLTSVETVRGAFSVGLTVRGDPGVPKYTVHTRDSEGVVVSTEFDIESFMSFVPAVTAPGSQLTIIITDWEKDRDEVVAVRIGGEPAQFAGKAVQTNGEEKFLSKAIKYDNCIHHPDSPPIVNGRIILTVDVPTNIPPGKQTVAVFDHSQLDYSRAGIVIADNDKGRMPCTRLDSEKEWGSQIGELNQDFRTDDPIAVTKATVEIATQDLTLTPSSAARGQWVTLTGSGFSRAAAGDNHITSVHIGSEEVDTDYYGFSEVEVGTDGSVAFSVPVPVNVADGVNEVRIEGGDNTLGYATLTVPGASIALEPAQGQRDTKFKVIGSGFIANEPVLVTYYSGTVITGNTEQLSNSGMLADSQGGFELTFKVPITAEVGLSHLVKAVAEVDTDAGSVVIEAETEHLVSLASITTTPDSVSPGDRLTIRGTHLPPFSLVGPIKFAGIPVNTVSEIATDEEGAFETTILVPQLDFRNHSLVVQVAWVIIPHIVTVAPAPLSGPPAQVFKELIRYSALSAVWRYDNASREWSLFDPSLTEELAGLNDLDSVRSKDIVWVKLTRAQRFQDAELSEGWSLIALK